MNWSDAQWKAIETKGKNMLVAAAAGSGKTAVLVQRIINNILNGVYSIDEILVVTFTRAAAAEMRSRIEAKLSEEIIRNPDNELAARQIILLGNASISTIDSFCQRIIRSHIDKVDFDPRFRVGSTEELDLMKQDVLEELFEQLYNEVDPGFLALVDRYGSAKNGDQKLYEMVLKTADFLTSQPFPELWLKNKEALFNISNDREFNRSSWAKESILSVRYELLMLYIKMEQLAKSAEEAAPESSEILRQDAEYIKELIAAAGSGWDTLYDKFQGNVSGLSGTAKWGKLDESVKKYFSGGRQKIKKDLKKLQEKYFSETPSEMSDDIKLIQPVIHAFSELVMKFYESFQTAKRERAIVDFSDLEHSALKLLISQDAEDGELVPGEIAIELSQKYKEIMIDEYQDTNEIQDAILYLLNNGHDFFAVGDVKQSIYRFRLAEPGIFMEKYNSYPCKEGCMRVDLSKNFRSRREILSAINFVFAQMMISQSMEIDYDADAALYPGFDYPECEQRLSPEAEIAIIDLGGKNDQKDREENDDDSINALPLEQQGIYISRRIHEMMSAGTKVWDKDANMYRDIEYRDIVVLMRSAKKSGQILLEAMRNEGIPVYAENESGYFEAGEVRVMLDLLSIIDNAQQDIPLTAVMTSEIGGFTVTEAGHIRSCCSDGSMMDALMYAVNAESSVRKGIRHKASVFLRRLDRWRDMARHTGVPELIDTLYRETRWYDYVGGLPGGLLRQANLRMLRDRALDYEKTSFRGLYRFLRFIEKMRDSGTDLSVGRTLSETENVVRIMTIHKSKGLEFPVVFIADMGKGFNMADATKPQVLLDKELGFGPYITDLEKSIRYPSFARNAISARINRESKAEELRVLYVAMTRAREKLIMVAALKDIRSKADVWCICTERMPIAMLAGVPLAAKNSFDWVAAAVSRHEDGAAIRELTMMPIRYVRPDYDDESHWKIDIIPAESLNKSIKDENHAQPIFDAIKKMEPLPATRYKDEIARRFDWHYNSYGIEDVPAKLSVTEMKQRFRLYEEDGLTVKLLDSSGYDSSLHGESLPAERRIRDGIFKRPAFMQENQRMTGTEYGTMIHSIMQHLNLDGDLSAEGIYEQAVRMAEREIIDSKHLDMVPTAMIENFFQSDIGKSMLGSNEVYRELPFSRLLDARNFYPDAKQGTGIFTQGVIDTLFAVEDGFALIDYKTDKDTNPIHAKERYELQIALYSEAVEHLLHRPIKEAYLYMIHNGSFIKMPTEFTNRS